MAAEHSDLYAHLVSCCLRQNDVAAAFTYTAAGKGRAFIDALATAQVDLSAAVHQYPGLDQELARAHELRHEREALQALLLGQQPQPGADVAHWQAMSDEERRTYFAELQAEERAHWAHMAETYPALTATQQTPSLNGAQAQQLADEVGATLVEFCARCDGWITFVITPNTVRYLALPNLTNNIIERMHRWR